MAVAIENRYNVAAGLPENHSAWFDRRTERKKRPAYGTKNIIHRRDYK